MASQSGIERLAEVKKTRAQCVEPEAKLDDVEPPNATLDFADKGLVLAQRGSELLLADASTCPQSSQLQQEVLVVGGVDGLLHRQAKQLLAASSRSSNMRRSLEARWLTVRTLRSAGSLGYSLLYLPRRTCMSTAGFRRMAGWSGRPLCSMYFIVTVGRAVHAPAAQCEVNGWAFQWALGSLGDGQHEVLGCWRRVGPTPLDWSIVRADLALRGVTRIHSVRSASGTGDSGESAQTLNCDRALGVSTRAIAGSLRMQCLSAQADAVAHRTQRALSRSLARHCAFRSEDDAAAFVDHELQRLDRGLWLRPFAKPRVRTSAHQRSLAVGV